MDRLDAVIQELREFDAERDWEQLHDPKDLAMAIRSEAGRLLAGYRCVRNAQADVLSRQPEGR